MRTIDSTRVIAASAIAITSGSLLVPVLGATTGAGAAVVFKFCVNCCSKSLLLSILSLYHGFGKKCKYSSGDIFSLLNLMITGVIWYNILYANSRD